MTQGEKIRGNSVFFSTTVCTVYHKSLHDILMEFVTQGHSWWFERSQFVLAWKHVIFFRTFKTSVICINHTLYSFTFIVLLLFPALNSWQNSLKHYTAHCVSFDFDIRAGQIRKRFWLSRVITSAMQWLFFIYFNCEPENILAWNYLLEVNCKWILDLSVWLLKFLSLTYKIKILLFVVTWSPNWPLTGGRGENCASCRNRPY